MTVSNSERPTKNDHLSQEKDLLLWQGWNSAYGCRGREYVKQIDNRARGTSLFFETGYSLSIVALMWGLIENHPLVQKK